MRNDPPDVHLDVVGDVHEAVARVLLEHPVDLDLVAAGDDVAVVVREADFDAVELAGALGPALGVLEHRLGPQLERMGLLDPLGRGKGPIARPLLGLGRIEHAEQRRPRGEVDVELGEVLGSPAEAQRVPVVVAVGKIVIVVVENVAEGNRERVVAGQIGIVVRLEADVDEAPVVPAAVGAVVGREVNDDGKRVLAPCAWRVARSVVQHRSGPSLPDCIGETDAIGGMFRDKPCACAGRRAGPARPGTRSGTSSLRSHVRHRT